MLHHATVACSWGSSFGLQGNFKIAYGAAFIMPPDYTFAMQFGLAKMSAAAAAISALMKGRLVKDPQRASCLIYRPKQATRLVKLADDLSVLALDAIINGGARAPTRADITADLVLSNLGYVPDLSAANKPGRAFKICGGMGELMAGQVRPGNTSQVRPTL
jgi:hypothetical protein